MRVHGEKAHGEGIKGGDSSAMTGLIILLAIGATIGGSYLYAVGCGPSAPDYSERDPAKELAWVERGQDAVRHKLKDPNSAQFSGTFFHRSEGGPPVACGKVNAKNGFGGYTGSQRFVSGGTDSLTFLENEVEGFESVWSQYCGGR